MRLQFAAHLARLDTLKEFLTDARTLLTDIKIEPGCDDDDRLDSCAELLAADYLRRGRELEGREDFRYY